MLDYTPLSLPAFRARLDSQQAARLLGFAVEDIPVLVRAGLLRPLGNHPADARCRFSAAELESLGRNPFWLDRATDAVRISQEYALPENVILFPAPVRVATPQEEDAC